MQRIKTSAMASAVQILALLSLSATVQMVLSMSCKDRDGEEVAWYYVVKLPILPNHGTSYIKNGLGYYYLDERNPKFSLSKNGIDNETSNPIEKTLDQFYSHETSAKASFLMYNDRPPAEENACNCGGHAKGVVAHDDDKGFWMIHSVPGFPDVYAYEWPSSADLNGQSILCLTFNDSNKGDIKKQLAVIRPVVYFQKDFDFHEKKISDNRSSISFDNVFQHFAKSALCEEDLYHFVAEELQIGLKAETWRYDKNGNCGTSFAVCNIERIEITPGIEFLSTKDHSKWAITWDSYGPSANKKYVCVGDLNRARTISTRGGGTMCANLPDVWKEYNNIIEKVERCNGETQMKNCYHDIAKKKLNNASGRRQLWTNFKDYMLSVFNYI